LQQLLSATLMNGVDWVMRCVKFNERLARADWVITGEGKLDASSFEGKVISGVVERATSKGIPVLVVCGRSALDTQECAARGLFHVETLLDHAHDESDAKARVIDLLVTAGERLATRM
jgi:glycerate kinase